MTLYDLWLCIKKHAVLVVVVTLIGACAGGAYAHFSKGSSSYEATARVVANSQVAGVAGIAASEARQVADELGVTVEAKAETASMTVTVKATGANANACEEAANTVAERSNEQAIESYADFESPYSGSVEKATVAASSADKSLSKFALVGLLAGLFIAICIVVIIDLVRRPVKSIEGVQEAVELPVLEKLPIQDGGERLLANVRFAAKERSLGQVCVVPVGAASVAEQVAAELVKAADKEGIAAAQAKVPADATQAPDADPAADSAMQVLCCRNFQEGMGGAYASQSADAVVLTVSQWSDSLKQLESSVAELQLAEAKLVGIVFGKEVK